MNEEGEGEAAKPLLNMHVKITGQVNTEATQAAGSSRHITLKQAPPIRGPHATRRSRASKRGAMFMAERPPLPAITEHARLLAVKLGDAAARGCSAVVGGCPPGLPATAAALVAGIARVAPAAAAAAAAGEPRHVHMVVVAPTLEDATQVSS